MARIDCWFEATAGNLFGAAGRVKTLELIGGSQPPNRRPPEVKLPLMVISAIEVFLQEGMFSG